MSEDNQPTTTEPAKSSFAFSRAAMVRALGAALVLAAAGAGYVTAQASNGCACGDACQCGPACQCGSAHGGGHSACNHAARR